METNVVMCVLADCPKLDQMQGACKRMKKARVAGVQIDNMLQLRNYLSYPDLQLPAPAQSLAALQQSAGDVELALIPLQTTVETLLGPAVQSSSRQMFTIGGPQLADSLGVTGAVFTGPTQAQYEYMTVRSEYITLLAGVLNLPLSC